MKFKIGDKVKLVGTKHGRVDSSWREYFGNFDVKAGDMVTIVTVNNSEYFVSHPNKGTNTNGTLHEVDVMDLNEKERERVATHIIVYDLNSGDPHIICYGDRDLKEQLKKLYDNNRLLKDSVKVYGITSESEVKISYSLKKKAVTKKITKKKK